MTHYLYVSRDWDGNWGLDHKIKAIVKGEHSGSGVGCGTRDLDFILEGELNQEQVDDLKEQIAAACGDLAVDVLYEEWDDETEEPIRSLEA